MSRKSCVTALASAAEYAAALSGGERGGGAHHAAPPPQLIVVDVHGWGGPTTLVEPLLRKLEQSTELWSRRVAVYSVDGALLSAEQRKGLPAPGSKPLFLVLKQQQLVAKVLGANAPELEAAIVEHMPAVSEV